MRNPGLCVVIWIFTVIRQSVPLIKAYAINKAPLPFQQIEKNRQFVALFPSLDDYSKSVFLTRITSEENVAKSLLPLLLPIFGELSKKQQELIVSSCQKFEIPVYQELKQENR